MLYFRTENPDGSFSYRKVSEAEGAPSAEDMGIDLTTAVEVPRLPNAHEQWDVVTGVFVEDLAAAEHEALALLDQRQDAAEGTEARSPTRIRSMMFTWYEVQDLKRVAPAAVGAMTVAERAARWPFLMALVAESGASLAQVATTAETALGPRVAMLARYEARAEMGRRAVQSASTAGAKRAAAEAVVLNGSSAPQGTQAAQK
jgi:hypothetical protein